MSQNDAGDRDAECARVGEIRQAEATGLVLLAEDHIPLGSDQRSPGADASLQRAANAEGDLGMAPPDLFEHGNGPDAGRRLQDRHNLAVPNLSQGVRPPAATRRFLLRG
jgi:hypothetical protein